MAAGDTTITVVGNLTADPELRFIPSGAAVANFTVASTPRMYDRQSGEWKDGDALFLRCNIWREAAENVAETLTRGMRVIVTGRLRQRSFETREGEKRTVVEVDEGLPGVAVVALDVLEQSDVVVRAEHLVEEASKRAGFLRKIHQEIVFESQVHQRALQNLAIPGHVVVADVDFVGRGRSVQQ